ncbi:hypothetical protein AB0K93_26620 [Streptomyces sp. NPDC052676]|uniref:hypothetical protein n=1 Tax=Streptomyces sp. NPDC052676 TaxID=3154953 RepID=UPI0034340460
MITRKTAAALGLVAASVGAGIATATPAAAGGIGDFLSPAFGTACANLNNGAHADGLTRSGTGTAGGNLAGLPIGSALNQCGGADLLPAAGELTSNFPEGLTGDMTSKFAEELPGHLKTKFAGGLTDGITSTFG